MTIFLTNLGQSTFLSNVQFYLNKMIGLESIKKGMYFLVDIDDEVWY
jgi:hypothetical protein